MHVRNSDSKGAEHWGDTMQTAWNPENSAPWGTFTRLSSHSPSPFVLFLPFLFRFFFLVIIWQIQLPWMTKKSNSFRNVQLDTHYIRYKNFSTFSWKVTLSIEMVMIFPFSYCWINFFFFWLGDFSFLFYKDRKWELPHIVYWFGFGLWALLREHKGISCYLRKSVWAIFSLRISSRLIQFLFYW